MTVRFLDPRGRTARPAERYELSVDIASAPVTVGLIANRFPDAARFTDHVEGALRSAVPGLRTLRYQKPDTSCASPDMVLQIRRECDAVVSAYGH